MRVMGFIGLLAVLLAGAQGAGAVQYTPEGIQLTVTVTNPPLAAGQPVSVGIGQPVTISLAAREIIDEVGANGVIARKIDDTVSLAWDATGGSLRKLSTTNNPSNLEWTSPATPGNYQIFITATDSGRYAAQTTTRQAVEVTVTQAGAVALPTVRVSANPPAVALDAGTTTAIVAQVLVNPPGNKDVHFFTTGGQLSRSRGLTDRTGVIGATLTVGPNDVGHPITVTASFGNTAATTVVQVVAQSAALPPVVQPPLPPLPVGYNWGGVTVTVAPATLPADGNSAATITVNTAVAGQPVFFRATAGQVTPPATITDLTGTATAQFTAPNLPDTGGAGYVVVTVGGLNGGIGLNGYAPVTFTPVAPAPAPAPAGQPRIFLTVDPTEAPADGAGHIRVEALLLDAGNHPLPDTAVTFSTTLGTLAADTARTDGNGRAAVTLTAADPPGQAVITAAAGQITAAGQLNFTGIAADNPTLDIKAWSGQQTAFVAEHWLQRQIRAENGPQSAFTQRLQLLAADGKILKDVDLGTDGQLIHDQYGRACGYIVTQGDKAMCVLLAADGGAARTLALPVPLGCQVREAQYADPAGTLLVTLAAPDGTRPQVYYYAADWATPLLAWKDGLESLPLLALGGDGALAVALPGGMVRLYNAQGQKAAEGHRDDGQPATRIAVGPLGEWFAVASGAKGQPQTAQVTVFSGAGGQVLGAYNLAARALASAGRNALAIATNERTYMLDLAGKQIAWNTPGAFTRFLAVGAQAVLAIPADPASTRLTIVQIDTGKIQFSQTFQTGDVLALLPPNDAGLIGLLSNNYAFRFALPKPGE